MTYLHSALYCVKRDTLPVVTFEVRLGVTDPIALLLCVRVAIVLLLLEDWHVLVVKVAVLEEELSESAEAELALETEELAGDQWQDYEVEDVEVLAVLVD